MTILPFSTQPDPAGSRRAAELLLPAAPLANHRLRYGQSVNNSRALTPAESIQWLENPAGQGREIKWVQVEGPGDPLAAPPVLFELLERLDSTFTGLEAGITTLGLGLVPLLEQLKKLPVRRVTLLVDCVDTAVAEKIYAWIRPGKKTLALPGAVELLIAEQKAAVQALAEAGIEVSIRTTVYPEVNDAHIPLVGTTMSGLGASSIELVPYRSGEDQELQLPLDCGEETLQALEKQLARVLNVLPGNREKGTVVPAVLRPAAGALPRPSKARPNVAVASSNGIDVDLHLGQAGRMLIYGPRKDGLACLLEARPTPQAGTGDNRWQTLAGSCLNDCFAVLAANAGENPRKVLAQQGIQVLLREDDIEATVDLLYGGGRKRKCRQ